MLDLQIDTLACRPPVALDGPRVLIVEDETMIVELLIDVLGDMGHRVCAVAATEDEAVAAALHTSPDLLLIDAILSVGSGVNAARRILQNGHVAHIFMSGERAILARLGGAVTLEKPFTPVDLKRAIASARRLPIDRLAGSSSRWVN